MQFPAMKSCKHQIRWDGKEEMGSAVGMIHARKQRSNFGLAE
jgi:hypothetical protein